MEQLNNLTKKDLINLISEMIEQGLIREESITELLNESMTELERIITDKLDNKQELTSEEVSYVGKCLTEKSNRQISSFLCKKKSFMCRILTIKIQSAFNLIWKEYPRKVGKELGLKAFTKLVQDKKVKDLPNYCNYIYNKVKEYNTYIDDNCVEERFIMHFSTYCNSKKYL